MNGGMAISGGFRECVRHFTDKSTSLSGELSLSGEWGTVQN